MGEIALIYQKLEQTTYSNSYLRAFRSDYIVSRADLGSTFHEELRSLL